MKRLLGFMIAIFLCLSQTSCFELFPVEKTIVARISDKNGTEYYAYAVAAGATTKDVIQIKSLDKNAEKLIATYEGYDSARLEVTLEGKLAVSLFQGSSTVLKVDSITIK